MIMDKPKLEWNEKYSVKVGLIDGQHKNLFNTINRLIDLLGGIPSKEQIDGIIQSLVEYKKDHFATEEKYFDEFNYQGAEEHKKKHREFNQKLEEIVQSNNENSLATAYKLADFLEDWLIDHLMTEDQKYITCFQEHGLR